MSDYVNNKLLDASPLKRQKEESQKLVAKWDKSGLLEGMENDWQKSGMATLLENQARQLISENSKTSPNAGAGVGDEEWSGVALPLVRRIFAEIAAKDFVSVQPMNLPSGLVFYLDFIFGKSVNGYGKETNLIGEKSKIGKVGELPIKDEEFPEELGTFWKFASTGKQDDRWYSWQLRNWGTKWNTYDDELSYIDDDTCLYYHFDTAWSPPEEAIEALRKIYTKDMGVHITAWFDEPAMEIGGYY